MPSPGAFWFDLRHALRGLLRDRSFTIAAIATLTLAISLNITVFALAETMLFRGFPLVQGNSRLLYMQERPGAILYPDFEQWRSDASAFQDLAFIGEKNVNLRDDAGRPLDTMAFTISTNTFRLLGVQPLLGRDFLPTDEAPGAPVVAILNHRFWVSRFARRPDIIGLSVRIDGAAATIIGVMPERFDFPTRENLWMPLPPAPARLRRDPPLSGFTAVGRLREGMTRRDALTQLQSINRRLEAQYPLTNRSLVPTVADHAEMNSGSNVRVIWGSLLVAAWFVFLIGCANFTNLILVRTFAHQRSISTRIALGAGIGRIARQITMECLLLSGIAATASWWIATRSVQIWADVTDSQYQILNYTVDSRTIFYLIAVALGAALIGSFAAVPAIRRCASPETLAGRSFGSSQGPQNRRTATVLVAAQSALAILLISGTGVLVRSFLKIVDAPTGVDNPSGVLVGSLRRPTDKYSSPEARRRYFQRIDSDLSAIPGVKRHAIARTIPVKFAAPRSLEIEGRPVLPQGRESVGFLAAGPDYFRVVGAEPNSGREFTLADHSDAALVAVVNRTFAARFWPGQNPIGRRLRSTTGTLAGEWRTVIGVVPDILQNDPLRQQFQPLVYIPFAQDVAPLRAYFLLRTPGRAAALAPSARARIQQLDPDVLLTEFGSMQDSFVFDRDFMDAEHSELRKHSVVALIFAAIAILLAAIGVYAVTAHLTGQRTKEIGIRIAVGAGGPDIRRLVLRDGFKPVLLGSFAGLLASPLLNKILQSQLVGVSPYDPASISLVPALVLLTALPACLPLVRRALKIDPVMALRSE